MIAAGPAYVACRLKTQSQFPDAAQGNSCLIDMGEPTKHSAHGISSVAAIGVGRVAPGTFDRAPND